MLVGNLRKRVQSTSCAAGKDDPVQGLMHVRKVQFGARSRLYRGFDPLNEDPVPVGDPPGPFLGSCPRK